jgi:hypothetical protein
MSHASRPHARMDIAFQDALSRDRSRAEAAQDRQRLAADRDADDRYREALVNSGDRFRDVDPVERRAADRDPPAYGSALVSSRSRLSDLRSFDLMNTTSNRRVLLTTLSVRTSAKGNRYLSGFLSKARVVGFPGEPDKFGHATWDLFVSTPEPRAEGKPATAVAHPAEDGAARAPAKPAERRDGWDGARYRRPRQGAPASPLEALDDNLEDLAR